MDSARKLIDEHGRSCPQGLTDDDVTEILRRHFFRWMAGQTCGSCDGREYNHEERRYEETSCHKNPHGIVIYPWDLERYLSRRSVVD